MVICAQVESHTSVRQQGKAPIDQMLAACNRLIYARRFEPYLTAGSCQQEIPVGIEPDAGRALEN